MPPQGVETATFGVGTVASNPGRIRLQGLHYLRCYPLIPVLCLVGLPLAALLFYIGMKRPIDEATPFAIAGLVIGAAALFGCGPRLAHVGKVVEHGDTCAAMIVDTEQDLVAVSVDMTTSPERRCPAIKIMRVPLYAAGLTAPSRGDRLTTVAVYYGSGTSGHWDKVEPVPVICATNDSAQIRDSLASVLQRDWDSLNAGLAKVSKPYQVGLYFV